MSKLEYKIEAAKVRADCAYEHHEIYMKIHDIEKELKKICEELARLKSEKEQNNIVQAKVN